jgi:hypothetical protein
VFGRAYARISISIVLAFRCRAKIFLFSLCIRRWWWVALGRKEPGETAEQVLVAGPENFPELCVDIVRVQPWFLAHAVRRRGDMVVNPDVRVLDVLQELQGLHLRVHKGVEPFGEVRVALDEPP